MNATNFIKNNPFPKNGAETNLYIVKKYQETKSKTLLYELLKTNARLIWVVYRQYNYGHEIDSIMSFVYEGIKKSADTYNFDTNVPFYIYALQNIRSLLQIYYNYNHELIHVPVKKKDDYELTYTDYDNDECMSIDTSNECDFDNEFYEDITNRFGRLIDLYKLKCEDNKKITNLNMLIDARQKTLTKIANENNLTVSAIKKRVDKALIELTNFYESEKEKIDG